MTKKLFFGPLEIGIAVKNSFSVSLKKYPFWTITVRLTQSYRNFNLDAENQTAHKAGAAQYCQMGLGHSNSWGQNQLNFVNTLRKQSFVFLTKRQVLEISKIYYVQSQRSP